MNTKPPSELIAEGLQQHQAGQLQDAEATFRQVLELDPTNADANYLLGGLAYHAGNFEDAVELASNAITAAPDHAVCHNILGLALQGLGRLDDAAGSYRRTLALNPDAAEAHINLANVMQAQGKPDDAVDGYTKAIALNPDFAEAHNNLGNALKELGRYDDARASLEKAVALNPGFAAAHSNLGSLLNEIGWLDDATQSYQRALTLNPELGEAHNNLGNVLQRLGRIEDAVDCYLNAIVITPDDAEAHDNLGTALAELGQWDEARESFQKALTVNPKYAAAHVNIGNTWNDQGQTANAIAWYRQALDADPGYVEALHNLGALFAELGRIDEAADCYAQAGRLETGTPRAAIKAALLLPPILTGIDAIPPLRQQLADKVRAIGKDGAQLDDPYRGIGKTGFYLAYHGLNDRDMQRAIAEMYLRVSPGLAYEGPPSTPGERIRVGIVSMHLHDHTIGKINLGIIENLDRDRFEVIVFRPPQKQDALAGAIDAAADRVVAITNNLEPARRQIGEENLGVLFYPDIGMEPLTYFLAFSRLAPVQVAGWGHPVTTGIPNVDYFLSSEGLEPPEAEGHYTERLIRLRHLPAFYKRPAPVSPVGRAHFGLPEDARLYIIPQTLFKFHPDFDPVLGEILRQDSSARLVLISGSHKSWDASLLQRFRQSFPDQADRALFVPRMGSDDFIRLLGLADALLDTSHFCGGFSSTEAFAAGLPIITWPGAMMRGRVTAAQYQTMGISDLIAEDAAGYVQLALRLAQDLEFRSDIKKRIIDNNAALFENIDVVRDIEQFFTDAMKDAR